jgi:excinuclease UvrABC nuclease subunit
MSGIKGHDYTWSRSWIEFKAPDGPGVYCLRDKEGKVLFIGKGKVRERLLSHWNRDNFTDAEIRSHAPATFCFELTDHPAERKAELIQELKPSCNSTVHSHFPKFW